MSPVTETNVINPLVELSKLGQSIWFDYIRRSLISSGELKRLIDEDNLKGVTSNPAIFEKAITGSNDYAEALDELRQQEDLTVMQVYESLAIRDIQDAGSATLEISPFSRTGATIWCLKNALFVPSLPADPSIASSNSRSS